MILTPVFEKESTQFVWEIDNFNLPDDIDILIDNSEWEFYNQYEGSNNRYITQLTELHPYMENATKIIQELIRNQTHYNYQWTWPSYFTSKCKLRAHESTLYLKDTPGFNMGIHIDNMLVFGTLIVNLRDCENSRTVYYSDNRGSEITYKGPTQKGTGIFHLNGFDLHHTGLNEGSDDRYIAMLNYCNHGLEF